MVINLYSSKTININVKKRPSVSNILQALLQEVKRHSEKAKIIGLVTNAS
jgi:hypothetical protein